MSRSARRAATSSHRAAGPRHRADRRLGGRPRHRRVAQGRRRIRRDPTDHRQAHGPLRRPARRPPGRARGPLLPLPGLPFRSVAKATSGLDGRFAFERAFDRNHQVRVLATEFGDRSAFSTVYVFPRTALSFDLVRRNVIRIVQTYRTPKNVKLTAPTLFYVGKAGKKRAPLAARAKTRPVAQGQGRQGPLPRFGAGADPEGLEGPLPLRELLPVQRGHGQPEAGLPEEELQVLSHGPRPRAAGRRRVRAAGDRGGRGPDDLLQPAAGGCHRAAVARHRARRAARARAGRRARRRVLHPPRLAQ